MMQTQRKAGKTQQGRRIYTVGTQKHSLFSVQDGLKMV